MCFNLANVLKLQLLLPILVVIVAFKLDVIRHLECHTMQKIKKQKKQKNKTVQMNIHKKVIKQQNISHAPLVVLT